MGRRRENAGRVGRRTVGRRRREKEERREKIGRGRGRAGGRMGGG